MRHHRDDEPGLSRPIGAARSAVCSPQTHFPIVFVFTLSACPFAEGLKALFRPITVIVPDLVLICENMLMAEGFQEAKDLAVKVISPATSIRVSPRCSRALRYSSPAVPFAVLARKRPALQATALRLGPSRHQIRFAGCWPVQKGSNACVGARAAHAVPSRLQPAEARG